MRTTVDLPDDVLTLARQLAHEQGRSMSDVLVELIRAGMRRDIETPPHRSPRGMPLVSVGRPATAEDVRSLDDE